MSEGTAKRAARQLQAVPLSRQAAIEAQIAGNPNPTATPEALAEAQAKRERTPKPAQADPKRGTQGYAKGGSVSASRRADGCAQRGKTKGRMI
jgi:hypothetical protein